MRKLTVGNENNQGRFGLKRALGLNDKSTENLANIAIAIKMLDLKPVFLYFFV